MIEPNNDDVVDLIDGVACHIEDGTFGKVAQVVCVVVNAAGMATYVAWDHAREIEIKSFAEAHKALMQAQAGRLH